MMKTQKWVVAGLQETHESSLAASELERANPRVWAFPNPGTTFSAGTMFLVGKDLLPPEIDSKEKITHEILVPRRAHSLTYKWREDEMITLVNIYAPNDELNAHRFFTKLGRKLRGKSPIIFGDFNHVEHAIDRQPQRDTQTQIRDALAELNRQLGLTDGWRKDNPGMHSFTWTALMTGPDGVTPRSRLDRFLASPEMCRRALKWEHLPSLGLSDHAIATAEFIDDLQPESGKTRWRMADEEINDPRMLEQTKDCLLACQKRLLKGEDPVTTWLRSKEKIRNIFETIKRSKAKERSSRIRNLRSCG